MKVWLLKRIVTFDKFNIIMKRHYREFWVSYKNVKVCIIPFKSDLIVSKVKRYKVCQVAPKHTATVLPRSYSGETCHLGGMTFLI